MAGKHQGFTGWDGLMSDFATDVQKFAPKLDRAFAEGRRFGQTGLGPVSTGEPASTEAQSCYGSGNATESNPTYHFETAYP